MPVKGDRKEVATQYPDISKILILNELGKWIEPARGKKFKARRYENKKDGGQERIKRSFETLAEAKAFRLGSPVKEIEKVVSVPVSGSVESSDSMMFEVLMEKWKQNWLPTVDLATQLRYRKYLKHYDYFLKMKVVDIEPSQIDGWIAHLKSPAYLDQCHSTRCSYDHEFKVLRAILNYYGSRCNRNYRLPFLKDHRKMLKVKDPLVIKKDLTVDQLKVFVGELKKVCWGKKWESIYYLALMQYAIYGRVQEAAALHAEDFDTANNRLEIKRKVQWLRTKGYKDRIVDGAKANGGKTFTPIPELALQVFNEWRMRSGVRSGLLFQMEGELITYRQIQHKYDLALRNAKLPFRSTHILRHAALSEAYDACLNILTVQKLGGQKSLKATERYTKARDQQVADTQRQMDERLSSIMLS